MTFGRVCLTQLLGKAHSVCKGNSPGDRGIQHTRGAGVFSLGSAGGMLASVHRGVELILKASPWS